MILYIENKFSCHYEIIESIILNYDKYNILIACACIVFVVPFSKYSLIELNHFVCLNSTSQK